MTVAMRMGAEHFYARLDDGRLHIAAGAVDAAHLTLSAPSANVFKRLIYGKAPPAMLAGEGLVISGDADLAGRFVDLFHLPAKVANGLRAI